MFRITLHWPKLYMLVQRRNPSVQISIPAQSKDWELINLREIEYQQNNMKTIKILVTTSLFLTHLIQNYP